MRIPTVVVFASSVIALYADDLEQDFRKAVEMMEAKQFREAIPLLVQVRNAFPRDVSVNANLGLSYAETGQHENALACWQLLCELESDNWHHASKVVQAYQALGRMKERDAAIVEVFERRKRTQDPSSIKRPWFCREQFDLREQRVMGVQYFTPEPGREVYFAFIFLDQAGHERFRISLGSYEPTNEIARATGEISADERLFHIDYYARGEHRTYGFYKRKLEYDEFRERVLGIVTDEKTPVSSSKAPTNVLPKQ